MECTRHGCSVGGKEWEENLRKVNVFWSPCMKPGILLSSLRMPLIITTTPWSEHIHSHSTNNKTKNGVGLQHPGVYTAGWESWVSTHPFTARCCWCPQYTVWFKRISYPLCEPKAHFLRWWERFRADWYLFHHWHRVYRAQLCNSGGPKCSPGLTWLALKVTPGWVAL